MVPLVRTKLVMPVSGSGYSERVRLNALLDRALDDNVRLALLSAPPGYGKTMALAGWFEARGVPRAGLSLGAADNDPARFARYLGAAVRAVRPVAGDAVADLFGPRAAPDPELVAATLLDELAASDDPFALVLDDYQVITA